MDGIYREKGDEGSVYHTKNIGDSFSFFLNVKPENRKDDQKQLLFSAGFRNIDFYRDRKSGQLIAETFTSCKDCGNNKKQKNVDGHYIFPGTNVEPNKLHSFAVSMDAENGRISVLMNGKRLKDINLGKDYTETYKKDVWSRGLILALHDSGDGALLTGYARDMVSYNRAVTGTELMELHKKYADPLIEVSGWNAQRSKKLYWNRRPSGKSQQFQQVFQGKEIYCKKLKRRSASSGFKINFQKHI